MGAPGPAWTGYKLGAASNDNWPSLFRADISGLPVCDGHQNNMLSNYKITYYIVVPSYKITC